jgi:hypothetical protein
MYPLSESDIAKVWLKGYFLGMKHAQDAVGIERDARGRFRKIVKPPTP